MKANVHADSSTLLAYHLQHPEINPYRYFGGPTLSCHGCGHFVTVSFNLSLQNLWIFPNSSPEVGLKMVTVLSPKLAPYVHRLRPDVTRTGQEAL